MLVTPRALPAPYAWLIRSTVVALFVLIITRQFLKREGLHWSEYGVSACSLPAPLILGASIGLTVGGGWAIAVNGFAPLESAWNSNVVATHVIAATLGTIAMGIAEEVGYRSYALVELRRRFGYAVALFLTSVVFVAAHVAGGVPWLAGLLVVGSASILFGTVMLETGSLPLVTALHVTTNLLQDNLLRPSPDALFTAHPRAPVTAGAELSIWLAMAGINLAVAACCFATMRSRRFGPVFARWVGRPLASAG